MPTLPKKKIGLISCSGEDLPEGLISRLSTLKVLEELRPKETVTLCLPLFLAGDEKERAFARVFPTIAIDGCSKRCATRATEMYSAKPARSINISEYLSEHNYPSLTNRRKLTDEEQNFKNEIADYLALIVDELFSFNPFEKMKNEFIDLEPLVVEIDDTNNNKSEASTCECGINLPSLLIEINNVKTDVIGLPVIFDLFYEQRKLPNREILEELFEKVKLYNKIPIDAEVYWKNSLESEYVKYCKSKNKES